MSKIKKSRITVIASILGKKSNMVGSAECIAKKVKIGCF